MKEGKKSEICKGFLEHRHTVAAPQRVITPKRPVLDNRIVGKMGSLQKRKKDQEISANYDGNGYTSSDSNVRNSINTLIRDIKS